MSNILKTILYRKCYEIYGNKDNPTCNGKTGGDFSTGYLSEDCINCPYWTYPSKKRTFKVKVKKCSKAKKIEKCLCKGELPPLYDEENVRRIGRDYFGLDTREWV